MFSCLACTFGQILILPIKLFHKQLFYSLNAKLCYCYFCLIPYLVENWGGFKVQAYGNKEVFEIFKRSNDKNMLVVMNHTGEVDWMIGWSIIDKIGLLGEVKTVIKDMVKYVPVFGWSFYLSDYIFVKRSAQKDIPRITKACDLFKDYPHNFVMSIFPEGTRFTEEKHEQSLKYAASNGLPQYKYHLLPRTKGLYHLVTMMKQNKRSKYIFDLEYAYRGEEGTALRFLNAEQGHCDVHIRFFPLADVPDDEGGFTEWLYQLFEEKDRLMDYHKRHNDFPGDKLVAEECYWRSKLSLFWAVASTLPILYTVCQLICAGQLWYLSLLLGIIPLGSFGFNLLIRITQSKHSSSYGRSSNSSTKKQD